MSDPSNLYPFLSGQRHDPAQLDAALLRSIEAKARESRETNARFFAEQGARLIAAARAIAGVYSGGGRLFTMGNGGSSCDAADRRSPRSTSSRMPRRCRRWATTLASNMYSCGRSSHRGAPATD
jgi:hypothetical protein